MIFFLSESFASGHPLCNFFKDGQIVWKNEKKTHKCEVESVEATCCNEYNLMLLYMWQSSLESSLDRNCRLYYECYEKVIQRNKILLVSDMT